ncbi:MAG TPA: thiamine pyrophosphate-dependent enzyme [Nitrososphaerales archaeon]|nr:thiamine pyrophosphate-dependent enzyme [Nitrososphaerales archaeon]
MSAQTKFKTLKDIPIEDETVPGGTLCAGCGGQHIIRIFHKVLGKDVVWVNAAGCVTTLYAYPLSPMKSSWMYTAFASAPAGAQGIRDALDILIEKGKVSPSDDLKVVVVSGDGAAYDIGLQSTSGAIQRDLDFYYLVYDNEAYGNTGFQMSSSTPFGSSSTTTPATSIFRAGNTGRKKDLFEIWRAHTPPYIATLSGAHLTDFMRKVEKAEAIKGPKLFLSLSACPTGWSFDPQDTIRVERLGVETGVWPLKEAVDGEVRHTYVPRSLKPVELYLSSQDRFRHLFKPTRNEEALAKIQQSVLRYWAKAGKQEGFEISLAK